MWAVDIPDMDIVLGWSWLEDVDPIIRFRDRSWCYPIDVKRITVVSKKKFWRVLRKNPGYAFMPTLAAASTSPDLP